MKIVMLPLIVFCMAARAGEELVPLTVPVRVHLVQSEVESALKTTLSDDDVKRVLGKVNKIWAQAKIQIEVESVVKTIALENVPVKKDPTDRWVVASMPGEKMLKRGLNIFYVKELTPNGFWSRGIIVVKDTARLREVPGGIDEPLPRVTAHELGHAFGLAHRQDVTNLMASGNTGFSLNAEEIKTARETVAAKFPAKN